MLDPYVQSKQKNWKPELISARTVQLDEARRRKTPPPPPAPETGEYCRTCGKELQSYDVEVGECFTHRLARIRAARQVVVMVTDDRTRQHAKKYQERKAKKS